MNDSNYNLFSILPIAKRQELVREFAEIDRKHQEEETDAIIETPKLPTLSEGEQDRYADAAYERQRWERHYGEDRERD